MNTSSFEATMGTVVRVRIGSAMLALDIGEISEILRMVQLQPVPGSNGLVKGALDLRGTILPVLDIASVIEQPAVDIDPSHFIVVAGVGDDAFGFCVHDTLDVLDVHAWDRRDVESHRPAGAVIRGLVRVEDGLMPVLDLEAIRNARR